MPDLENRYRQQYQCRDLWCWAAVAVSLVRYYHPGATLTQCAFAHEVFKRSDPPGPGDCCGGACNNNCGAVIDCSDPHRPYPGRCYEPEECDRRAVPEVVLKVMAEKYQLRYTAIGVGEMQRDRILAELQNERPVVLRREDGDSNGHLIVPASLRNETIVVLDPEGDCKDYSLDLVENLLLTRRNGNRAVYTWIDTYVRE